MSLMSDIPAFEYTPLEPDHFRLLHIDSILNGVISCKLAHQPLQHANTHHALSYCWGSDVKDHTILVNDRTLKITTSLFAALEGVHQLSDREDENQCRDIWADAICINQEDQVEKLVQVQRMDLIYRHAKRVIVCLGAEESGSSEVMSILSWVELYRSKESSRTVIAELGFDRQSLHSENKGIEMRLAVLTRELEKHYHINQGGLLAFQGLLSELTERELRRDDVNIISMKQLLKKSRFRHIFAPNDPFWRNLLGFMSKPWFSRVWTYQEIFLAQHATAVSDDMNVDWTTVKDCRNAISEEGCMGTLYDIRYAMSNMDLIVEGVNLRLDRKQFEGTAFQALLIGIYDREAKDPGDFIFGLMGMVSPKIRSRIPIDYGTTESAVFAHAMAVACNTSSCRGLWCTVMERYSLTENKPVKDLHTWCPDFTQRVDAKGLSIFKPGPGILEEVRDFYDFSSISVDENDLTLSSVGVPLDTFEEPLDKTAQVDLKEHFGFMSKKATFDCHLEVAMRLTCTEATSRWLGRLSDVVLSKANEQCGTAEAMLRRILDPNLRMPLHQVRVRFNLLRAFCQLVQEQPIKAWKDVQERFSIDRAKLGCLTSDLWEVSVGQCGRYFFLTLAGRAGFVPRRTNAGDIVCFIPGGKFLHIISSDSTKHITIASVDGLMDDKISGLSNGWKNKWETFHLT